MAPHFFNDNVFEDCDLEAFTYVPNPNPGWANPKDCGNFPCTAPHNVFFRFHNTYFTGTTEGFWFTRDF